LREIDLMKISHRNAIHYLIKPVNGHPWDWQLLSLIGRCPDYRGQN
jgi:hypothetical protein